MAVTLGKDDPTTAAPDGPRPHGLPWNQASSSPVRGEDQRSFLQNLKGRIIRLSPRPIVRALARPYIAGETRGEALALARRLWERKRLQSTVDVLGEAITETSETRTMLDEYLALVSEIGRSTYASVSVKLTALGQGLDDGLCARNLETLLKRAAESDVFVRFDMEDHTTVDSTLAIYRQFAGRFPGIGIVLQSRLFRTPADVDSLAQWKPNVRLCIGIYREKPEIAFQDKPAMKRRMIELLDVMWSNQQTVALATHDEKVIREAIALSRRKGIGPDRFQVEMLLGVPRGALQKELVEAGFSVRLYVPYGAHWYRYCLRRLEHNPEMASLVLKNLLGIG